MIVWLIMIHLCIWLLPLWGLGRTFHFGFCDVRMRDWLNVKGGVSRDRKSLQLAFIDQCLVNNALSALVVIQVDRAGRHFSMLRRAESAMYSCGCSRAGISPASRATRCNKPLCQVGSKLRSPLSKKIPDQLASSSYLLFHSVAFFVLLDLSIILRFSVWSESDNLYDDITKHWSGSPICLSGMILIDGKPYRYVL